MHTGWKRAVSVASPLALGLVLSLNLPAQAACDWTLFPTVNPEPTGNQLTAVDGTSATDVWEIGAAFHTAKSSGYAIHWDGRSWATFAEDDPKGHGGQFSGIASIAQNDVWAVGQAYAASNYRKRLAVAEHWNGTRFNASPLPSVVGQETFLYGIAAVAPNDVWAAGGSLPAGGLQQSYVVHWDGNAWTQIAAPGVPGSATNFDAVAKTGANDVWVVGGSEANTSAPFRTLAEHWDGTRWTIVPTPNVNANSNIFNAVVAIAPNDAWAIGDYYNGKAFSPLAEHWDGTSWNIVRTPNSGSHTAFVLGATAVSSREVFAVGEIARSHGEVASYILRWDGTKWFEAASPNVPHRLVTLFNGVKAIPGGSVWAVGGDANTKIVIHTVTAVRNCTEETSRRRR